MADELLTTLSFSLWLRLEETPLFSAFKPCEISRWLLNQELPELSAYVSTVSLLKMGDSLYKLDGQHLKQAFLSGQKGIPDVLFAKTYEVDAKLFAQLVQSLGHMVNNEPPSPQDEIKLIFNDLGLVLSSDRIRNGFISEALNIALRGNQRIYQDKRRQWRDEIDMKKAVSVMSEELLLMDSLNLKAKIFNTGVLSACLIMLAIQSDIKDFIVRLNNETGETKGEKYDPVECVLRAIKFYKASAPSSKRRGTITLCQITVQSILLWLQGKDSSEYWRKTDLIGVDHLPLVRKLRHLKGLHEATDI
jgi:hypothetical protein